MALIPQSRVQTIRTRTPDEKPPNGSYREGTLWINMVDQTLGYMDQGGNAVALVSLVKPGSRIVANPRGNVSGDVVFNFDQSPLQDLILTGNGRAVPPGEDSGRIDVIIHQDATGGRTLDTSLFNYSSGALNAAPNGLTVATVARVINYTLIWLDPLT